MITLSLSAFVALYTALVGITIIYGIRGCHVPFYWLASQYYFRKYNRICFNNKLDPLPIKITSNYIHEDNDGVHATIGMFTLRGEKPVSITISCLSPNWRLTLLHEMVHYFDFKAHVNMKTLYIFNSIGDSHLPYFEALLLEARQKVGV